MSDPPRGLVWKTRIDADHPALAGHFPGHPVVPGVVLLTEVMRAVRALIDADLMPSAFTVVKFSALVAPGEALSVALEPGAGGRIAFSIQRAGGEVAQVVASGMLLCARQVSATSSG